MDSVAKQTSSAGFDKDGNFLNSQTELLPWPKPMQINNYRQIDVTPKKLPNPYEFGGYFIVDADSEHIHMRSPSASLVWSKFIHPDIASLNSQTSVETDILGFYDDGVKKWLLGGTKIRDLGNYWRYTAFKINIDDPSEVVSKSSNNYTAGFMTLPDNSALVGKRNVGTSGGWSGAYALNLETMAFGSMSSIRTRLGQYDFEDDEYVANQSMHPSQLGFILLGGEAEILNIYLSQSQSVVNIDLYVNQLGLVKTKHCLSNDSFFNPLIQLSRDVYFEQKPPLSALSKSPDQVTGCRYYSRQALDEWVSGCIYVVTGVKIPVPVGVV